MSLGHPVQKLQTVELEVQLAYLPISPPQKVISPILRNSLSKHGCTWEIKIKSTVTVPGNN